MPSTLSARHCPLDDRLIGVYTGNGASHSWLWFVEILDQAGAAHIQFVDDKDIHSGGLAPLDVLLMSGGDTFAIAEGLGAEGSEQLRKFLEAGGLYIGTCAGAYLPLKSSMVFLNQFNFLNVKISNISRRLSEPDRSSVRHHACTAYGCDFVYHAVREEVVLEMANGYRDEGAKEVIAPLYGGPSMLPSEDIEPVATYKGFTKKTKFLVGQELAERTLIGNIAIAKKAVGDGHLFAFGPHFEHPRYPDANGIITQIILKESRRGEMNLARQETPRLRPSPSFFEALRRELSHSRIVAFGLEGIPIEWRIGNKGYEPEKIRVFLEAMWKRLKYLESRKDAGLGRREPDGMVDALKWTTHLLREIAKRIDQREATAELAETLFPHLKRLTSEFLTLYFRSKRIESGRS
jgi:glutamine amidotransferase-like uncharacterized protein